MRKNVTGQTVGAQMITAADGSAFTGAVTVVVTGDGGTQGGGGAAVHEGNGYHSYAPTQAETNFNHIAFTFTGIGAIPATVQLYTVDELLAVLLDTSRSLADYIRGIGAAMMGVSSGGGTSEITMRNLDDTKDAIVATCTTAGNRTNVDLDLT